MDRMQLAERIASVINDHFVFDMPDIEDMIQGNADQLSTLAGCYDVIGQLLDIIREAE